MKKVFSFGKVDWYNKGRRNNLVEVEVTYEMRNGGMEFSAAGRVWNNLETDWLAGGQCLEKIAKDVKSPLFAEILDLWRKYHLNGLHPECEHQRALGWREIAKETIPELGRLKGHTYESEHPDGILAKACPVCGYKYGTSWVYMPIPEEDEKRILKLFEE